MAKKTDYGIQDSGQSKGKGLLTCLLILLLAFVSLAAMCAATQKVAAAYGYQAGLGQPWFVISDIAIYAPWSIFEWSESIDPGVLDGAMTLGQFVFIGPLFLIGGLYMAGNRNKGNATLHGSAHWARKDEIEKLGYFAGKGVYVGGWWDKKAKQQKYLRHNGPEHILCFAPTRSGKGVGLILPTLLSWPGSSLVLDIKGENWALTAGWRKAQGQKVLRFDPSDASGSGCRFNPVAEIRLTSLEAIQDVQNMALMLVDPDGKGLEDHWTKAAFGFFSGLILHCCIMVRAKEKRDATLFDLTHMMADESRTTEELLDEMLEENHSKLFEEFSSPEVAKEVGSACHTFIASSAREMKSKSEKEASGVLSSALVNMALYRDPIVTLNTSDSDFKIHDLMNCDEPVNLFLVVSPAAADRVKPLMRLIVDMIIRRVCAEMKFEGGTSVAGYKHRLLLMLDEFTSLGKLPIIEKAIAYIAGYGGKMYIIVQDTKQLNGVYGKENAIMANCHVRIAYAPNDPETADLLSKMTGQTTVVEKKVSISSGKGGSSRSTSISETARPLLTPDECMRLPGAQKDSQGKVTKPGHMLIFTAGQSPIYGMQILYFLDPTFSQRAKMPAPGISNRFPAGITDSIYSPRPDEWFEAGPAPAPQKPKNEPPASGISEKSDLSFADFLKEEKE